jgi:Tfp pilus assembly protein PilX
MSESQRTQGFAIVVVLLISLVILMSVVTTASVTTLTTRVTTADERVAYQALLTAESGINSLEARIRSLPTASRYHGPFNDSTPQLKTQSLAALNAWLNAQGLATLELAEANQVTLSITDLQTSPTERITVRSTGTLGDRGVKLVLVDFVRFREARLPPVSAALTSWPDITVSGNAMITGQAGTGASGQISNLTTVTSSYTIKAGTPSPYSFVLQVDNATLIRVRGYLVIGGHTYRVASREGSALQLTTLERATAERAITAGTPVHLIPYATAVEVRSLNATTFKVSDALGFLVGDTIFVGVGVGARQATVTGIDHQRETISVSWVGAPPSDSSPIAEGTPITRAISGATSHRAIEVRGNATVDNPRPHNSAISNPFALDPTRTLFYQIFKLTYQDFTARYPTVPSGSFNGVVSGVRHVSGHLNLTGNSSICGRGVLVVNGDLIINGSCQEGFYGLIYVRGQYRQQGNSTINGAVVAEGRSELGHPSEDTALAGTGQGEAKLGYDPRALLEASLLIAPAEFSLSQGSWRQR